jgi:hypothetical protein
LFVFLPPLAFGGTFWVWFWFAGLGQLPCACRLSSRWPGCCWPAAAVGLLLLLLLLLLQLAFGFFLACGLPSQLEFLFLDVGCISGA